MLLLVSHPVTRDWEATSVSNETERLSGETERPGSETPRPGGDTRRGNRAGGAEAAGPSTIVWGQIDLKFPAALLPPPPFHAEITYRSPPGVSSKKVSGQLPTAYVGSASLALFTDRPK